jgi:hypothetical protein
MGGDLRVWRGTKKKLEPVAKPTQLEVADRIGSPKGDPVILMSDDDIVLSVKGVKVGEKSGLSLVRSEAGLIVRLQDGSLLVDAFEKPLTVETAGGRVTGKQAYFLVEVREGVSKVTAIDGSLTFSNAVGEVTVETGQTSAAKAGEAPSAPVASGTVVAPADFVPKTGAAVNLLKNAGFEEDLSVGWNKPESAKILAIDTQIFNSGRASLRATITPETVSWRKPPYVTELGILQPVKWTIGRRYLVRIYLRAKVRKGPFAGSIGIDGVKTEPEKQDLIFQTIKCGEAWKMHRTIVTASKASGSLGVQSVLDEPVFDATYWIDDCAIVELPEVKKP